MPSPPQSSSPIGSEAELPAHFAAGEKPAASHRFGVEHEKIPVLAGGVAPGHDVIEPLLQAVARGSGWQEVREGDKVIGLSRRDEAGPATVSLEPGGQTELSGAPRGSAREAEAALRTHLAELSGPARALGVRYLALGFRPFGTLDDVPWMPKGRYRVMRAYLPGRGALAHEMMKRTATVQVNLDYADQADCATKLRAAMGLSSLITALFSCSPLVDGRATDYQSYRAACWLATDEDRCGLLDFAFAPDAPEMLYRRYTEWALDVPMFFVYRGGEYRPAEGMPFRRFLREGWAGERATAADWELHLSTLFPEVRLKRYLELRAADAGPLEMVLALAALARGLMHDPQALEAGWQLVAGFTMEERRQLRRDVPRLGMQARAGGQAIAGRCRELVAIARAGLVRIGGGDDAPLLDPLQLVATTGRSAADEVRDLHRRLGGNPDALIEALALPLA